MWISGDFDRRWLIREVGELTLHSDAFGMQTIANGSGGRIPPLLATIPRLRRVGSRRARVSGSSQTASLSLSLWEPLATLIVKAGRRSREVSAAEARLEKETKQSRGLQIF